MTTLPAGGRLAGWFVTARHRRTGTNGEPRPWGAVHVKRIGEPRTACGVVCLGWLVFWRLPAGSVLSELCAACYTVVAGDERLPVPRCTGC
jgi:hypothetical protein